MFRFWLQCKPKAAGKLFLWGRERQNLVNQWIFFYIYIYFLVLGKKGYSKAKTYFWDRYMRPWKKRLYNILEFNSCLRKEWCDFLSETSHRYPADLIWCWASVSGRRHRSLPLSFNMAILCVIYGQTGCQTLSTRESTRQSIEAFIFSILFAP